MSSDSVHVFPVGIDPCFYFSISSCPKLVRVFYPLRTGTNTHMPSQAHEHSNNEMLLSSHCTLYVSRQGQLHKLQAYSSYSEFLKDASLLNRTTSWKM